MIDIVLVSDLPEAVTSDPMAPLWVSGANARASRVAPCLTSTDEFPGRSFNQLAEAKLILVGAILRWAQAGAGAVQSRAAGPFSETLDTRQRTGYNLWPSEITQLQDICKSGAPEKAYAVDTVQSGTIHSPICSVYFGGGGPCSCGAIVAGVAIYE